MEGVRLCALTLLLCACGDGARLGGDAATDAARRMDAPLGARDAPPLGDALPLSDAPHLSDGRAVDARRADAALADGPSFGACIASGVPGTCIDVAACDGGRVPTPGLCPGPAAIQCCHAPPGDGGAGMCVNTVMPTPNAGIAEPAGLDGCPSGMTRVATFCIDRWEAFLEEVRADGSFAPWSPFHNPGTRQMRARSAEGAIPQGYINGQQAGAACTRAGKRLCTDTEWLRACRGPQMLTYPYGNARMTGVCNDHRAMHPAVELFPNDPNPFARIGDACINQLHDTVDRAGARAGCVTAEGVLDMMGNLHEWTADPAGTFRGGYYVDTVINGNGCLYATTAHDTGHWDYSTGFRCCAAATSP